MEMEYENAIEVRDITKSFKVYLDKGNTFKEKVIFRNRRRYEERSVLKGISFDVKRGEAIGLIGHNGCGKSTTLKLLTRIMYPDSGSIQIKGRVSSLIELGAGFHPDMSGRENIYINASIFGLTKKEIDRRVADIIIFSELEEFIDNPVRTYSSGMYMRLAFSVAINVDAEVLLIDEILAVGDVNFQQKCFEKLKEIKRQGTTIVIVSHSLSQIEQICERSIWIDKGKVREEGKPKEVHERYLSAMEQERMDRIEIEEKRKEEARKAEAEKKEEKNRKDEEAERNEEREKEETDKKSGENEENNKGNGNAEGKKTEGVEKGELNSSKDKSKEGELKKLPSFCNSNAIRRGNQKVEFTNIYMLNHERKKRKLVRTGEDIRFIIEYQCNSQGIEGTFGLGIYKDDGIYCYGTNTDIELKKSLPLDGYGKMEIRIPRLQLLAGKYSVNIAVHSKDTIEIYDYIWNVIEFQVFNTKGDDGLYRMDSVWVYNGVEIIDNRSS